MATSVQRPMVAHSRHGMQRIPSKRELRRIHSAPTLHDIWEPNEGEEAAAEREEALVIARVDSPTSTTAHLRNVSSENNLMLNKIESMLHAKDRSPIESGALPSQWGSLLADLSLGSSSLSPMSQAELVMAVQDSLRHQGHAPLRLRHGKLEQHYTLRRELHSGADLKVMEGVSIANGANFSLKIIRAPQRLRLSGKAKVRKARSIKRRTPPTRLKAHDCLCTRLPWPR